MVENLTQLQQEASQRITDVKTINQLNEFKAYYLGKKSPLQEIMSQMKNLSLEERKILGQQVNQFKDFIEELIIFQRQKIEQAMVETKLAQDKIDVTLPGRNNLTGTLHPLTQTIQLIEDFFVGLGYKIEEGLEVEEDLYNFEMLNIPKNHPARDMQDTFYITDSILLRTHTSPVQIHTLLREKGKPVKIICPGKVYRRDDDDATHSHQFMQIEGLVVDKKATMADLKGTLALLMQHLFGKDREIRFRPSFFPFTEPSVEVDVSCFKCNGKGCPMCKHTGWIEILGAGMVHPRVLEMAGYDSKIYQGFAFGLGVERVTMLRNEIDDIRHFYTNDIRFLHQF
ncbi:MAG: phenylalanine--tRNA ligase subunit alpha [Acholeplasmataceae bacterium]|nr:phenylalanine--tRNA ligase subunit alpha [Acholeplasmataceae bacterium]HPT89224.1 phenylalanine--tRNA ligase subunit alpha [Bacilli bacterium]HQA19277.1 phenylalanine--tRNA ligase subunit alpha [Bacilli bacterium]HQD92938.1 phenylalanine--tRNA ligase subunit alpha [Bacilli bacterium]